MDGGASRTGPSGAGRRALFVVTEDWYFLSHRLPMARAARDAGYEVHVAARVGDGAAAIESEGFMLHPVDWRRGRAPARAVGEVARLRALYRRLRPDLIHHVALKPTVVGGAAARGLDAAIVNSVTGLGYVFTAKDAFARAVRLGARLGVRPLLNRAASRTIVQNPDDAALLRRLGVEDARLTLIRGSGVDVAALRPVSPPPAPPVRAAFVGRMLEIKGVRDLMAAYRILRDRGVALELSLAGAPDPMNPTALSEDALRAFATETGARWLGHVRDVGALWAETHIAIAPSRGGEGVPKSLLEAAACGRPMVSTDTAGCREIALQGTTAETAPPGDPQALADAIERLASDADARARYGAAARRLAETEFAEARIGAETVAVYDGVLDERARRRAERARG